MHHRVDLLRLQQVGDDVRRANVGLDKLKVGQTHHCAGQGEGHMKREFVERARETKVLRNTDSIKIHMCLAIKINIEQISVAESEW
jgi:hypothetical protein